ncbi:MAG: T9SS type A sorting domain-containing protein [Bacteroidota bacterium]
MPRSLFAMLTVVVAALMVAVGAAAQTCTTTYTAAVGNGDGNGWFDDGNWDNGVPTPADTACVSGSPNNFNRPVTAAQPVTLAGLVAEDGRLTLTFDSGLALTGRGRISGNALDVSGDVTLESGAVLTLARGRILPRGGTLTVEDGATLRVEDTGSNAGSSIGSASAGGVASTFVLRGTLLTNERLGIVSTLNVEGGRIAVAVGTVHSQARFYGPGALSDATLDVAEDAALRLDGDYSLEGSLTGTADGLLSLGDGAVTVAAGGVTVGVGGVLGLVIGEYGATEVSGGDVLNTRLLRFSRGGQTLRGFALRTTGTLRLDTAARIFLADGSTLDVAEAGTLLFTDALGTGNRAIYGNSISDPGAARIALRGRIVEEGSAAADAINIPVDVLGGEISARTGRLDLRAGGSMVDPSLNGDQGAELQLFGAWDVEGTVSGQSAATPTAFEDDVTVVFGASSSTSTSFRAVGEVTLDVGGAGIELGVSAATGVITAAPGGGFVNRSAILQKGQTILRGVTLRNEGEVSGGGFRLEEDARFVNASGATATFRSGVLQGDGTGAFVNEGLVQTNQNGSLLSFRGLLDSRSGSELRVGQQPGATVETLNLSQEDPGSYGAGVTISGRGGVSTGFQVLLQGTISPGTPEAPFDTLGVTSLRFSATEGDPRFVMDIGDGVSDLVSTGDAGILEPGGATLVIRVADGFTPAPGDEWVVARRFSNNAPSTGVFPTVEIEGAPPGIAFIQDPDASGAIVIRAVADGLAVAAREATVAEGASGAFVLTHSPSPVPYVVTLQASGTATRFADYTLGATGGAIRVRANTTQTGIPILTRRDADANEGDETVTIRLGSGATGEATLTITDGPSTTGLAVNGIAPSLGSTAGQVTAAVYGTGFAEGATVRLVGPSTIEGAGERLDENGALVATFDLRTAAVGTYSVEVTSGGTATLAGAFTVTDEALAEVLPLWGAITGTPNPRRGRFSTYTITIGNDGPVDLFDILVPIRITQNVEYEVIGLAPVEGFEDAPIGVDTGEQVTTGAYIPSLPAGGSQQIRVRVRPTQTGQDVGVGFQINPPNPDALYTYSGDLDDFAADLAAGRPTNWAILAGLVLEFSDPDSVAPSVGGVQRNADPSPWCPAIPVQSPLPDLSALVDAVTSLAPPPFSLPSGPPPSPQEIEGTLSSLQSQMNLMSQQNTMLTNVVRSHNQTALNLIGGIGRRPSDLAAVLLRAGLATSGGPGNCGGGTVVGSFDPNDKLGPIGVDAPNYYRPDGTAFPYTIRFENIETATAPAQEVVVTDSLDTSVFDLSTFRFGTITFGASGRIEPPAAVTSFEATVDLSDAALGSLDATLLVTGALDLASGVVTWRFATLDPVTGNLPEDALVGFLPPNGASPEGEGAVSFTVATFGGLASGAVVENEARIVFDVNEPIDTPVWTNTVDTTPPVTSVDALGAESQAPFEITVSGGDAGAGVQAYALFARRDGDRFDLAEVSDEPAFTFDPPEPGLYSFYVRAIDAVGNVEPPKTEAEAATTVAVDGESGPDSPLVLTLGVPRPNPATGPVFLRYGLPDSGEATVRVLDLLGREVAVLAEGTQHAGWHVVEWAPAVAAGSYVVQLRTGSEVQTRRLTIVQ